MGEPRHEAVIAVIHHDEPLKRFRDTMPEDYRRLLIISANPGGGYSCVLLPDGSKEGFAVSNVMDAIRGEFIELLKDLDADWAHVVLYDEAAITEPMEGPGPRFVGATRWRFNGRHWKRLRRQDY
ncbi:MAG: hypothetical protein M3176_04135 [Chloroflexota bacterium]|nr:hypothetical protein [Chloroflexota bacterium]MDQ6905999.1 hypothetical protein [Chloroflexota bacterium]